MFDAVLYRHRAFAQAWWSEKEEAQKKLKKHEDPAYTLAQVGDKVHLTDSIATIYLRHFNYCDCA